MNKKTLLILILALCLTLSAVLAACNDNRGGGDSYCDIVFDSNGGSEVAPLRLTSGSPLTLPEPPTKSGYEFGGWCLDKACTTDLNVYQYKVSGNAVLYAKWIDVSLYPYIIKGVANDSSVSVANVYTSDSAHSDNTAVNAYDVILYFDKYTATKDDTVTVNVNVNKDGYELDRSTFLANGTLISGDSFLMTASPMTVTFDIIKTRYSVTVVDAANGNVYAERSIGVVGESVSLDVVPYAGYKLATLTVNGESVTDGSFVMPAENVVIFYSFAPISGDYYNVMVDTCVGGRVETDLTEARAGDYVICNAIPSEGYRFDKFVCVTNGLSREQSDPVFIMSEGDTTVSALFVPTDGTEYVVSVNSDITGGAVSASSAVANAGGRIKLTAVADGAYSLCYFIVDGEAIYGDTFYMPTANVSVSALFQIQAFSIAAAACEHGEIEFNRAYANAGDCVTLKLTPQSGYRLVDGSLKINGEPCTVSLPAEQSANYLVGSFVMPSEAVVVSAEFESEISGATYAIGVDSTITHGRVVLSTDRADAGDLVYLNVIADDNYRVKYVKYNETLVSGGKFVQPAVNVIIHAVFERVYTITSFSSDSGYAYAATEAACGEVVSVTYGVGGFNKAVDRVYYVYNNREVDISGNTFVMPDGNVTLGVASIAINTSATYRLSVEQSTGAKLTADRSVAAEGVRVTLSLALNDGYKLKRLYYTLDSGAQTDVDLSFVMPAAVITLHAECEQVAPDTLALDEFYVNYAHLINGYGGSLNLYDTPKDVSAYFESLGIASLATNAKAVLVGSLNTKFVAISVTKDIALVAQKAYYALLSQSGGNAEISTVTDGGTIVFVYNGDAEECAQMLKYGIKEYADGLVYLRENSDCGLLLMVNAGIAYAVPKEADGRALTHVYSYAFSRCASLKYLSLGNVGALADYALSGLQNVATFDLSGVSEIGSHVFDGCIGIERFVVAGYNYTLKADNSGGKQGVALYTYDYSSLIKFASASGLQTYTVNTKCSVISDYAFEHSALTTIRLSKVNTIGDCAFFGVSSLSEADLGLVTSIGRDAFYIDGTSLTLYLSVSGLTKADGDPIAFADGAQGTLKLICNVLASSQLSILDEYRSDGVWGKYAELLSASDNSAWCIVYFESLGGTYTKIQKVNVGGVASKPEAPTREGYEFGGWYLDMRYESEFAFATTPLTASLRLYAKWIEI